MSAITTRAGKGSPLTNAEVDANFTNLNAGKEEAANKGVANGYAGLDATGKVPTAQLPSYVDDVLEFANLASFPATGEAGKIYVALDNNKTYRWSGSIYVFITSGAVDSVAGKTGVVLLDKADVGLGNVDNTSDANKPISTAQQAALDLKVAQSGPTGAMTVPSGNTAARPASPPYGSQRANSQLNRQEWFNGTNWVPMAEAAGAAEGDLQYRGPTGELAATNLARIDGGNLQLIGDWSFPYTQMESVKLYGYLVGKIALPAVSDYSAWAYPLQGTLWSKMVAYWKPPGNAVTLPAVVGMAAPTAIGTVTARNVAATNALTRSRRLGYVSGAAAASFAGHYIPVAQLTTGSDLNFGGFIYACRFAFSDAAAVAGARAFIGLSSSIAAPTNVNPDTLTNSIGVAQLSADSTQLYIVCAGSAAQVAIPTGMAPMTAAGANNGILYDLIICASSNLPGTVTVILKQVGVNGAVVSQQFAATTLGVEVPLNTTLLAHRAWRCTNATALAVGMDISSVYFETNE